MAVLGRGRNRTGETKASTEKSGVLRCAQTFARAGETGEDGAAVVAAEVDGAIEMLRAQGPDDGPILAQAGFARHGPDAVHGGMMPQERDRIFRNQGGQFTIGKTVADGDQRRDARDGADAFEPYAQQ